MTGSNNDLGTPGVKKAAAVNMIGAVSPETLAVPKIEPVRIPGIAAGNITFLMVCHFVAPHAREASLKLYGTALIASSEVDMMYGSIITASVNAPANKL